MPRDVAICDCGSHAWTGVGRGFVTFVDPDDSDLVAERSWVTSIRTLSDGSLYHRVNSSQQRKTVSLHRMLLQAPSSTLVDHIDGDGLNNRRGNLRLASAAENTRNRRFVASSSGYKGVWFEPRKQKFRAAIDIAGKRIYLGYYQNAEHAALAYDEAARLHFGQFARPNFALSPEPRSEEA